MAIAALLGAFLLLGGIVALVIVIIRLSRSEQGFSTPQKVGCTIFAILALVVVFVMFHSMGGERPWAGDEAIVIVSEGAEVFSGDVYLGSDEVELPWEDLKHSREYPAGREPQDVVTLFYPDFKLESLRSHSSAGAEVGNNLHRVQTYEVRGSHPDGRKDSFCLVERHVLQHDARNLFLGELPRRAWIVRVRNGAQRDVQVSGVGGGLIGRTFFQTILGHRAPPRLNVFLSAKDVPEQDATYWSDAFDATLPPAEAPSKENR